MDSGCNSAQRQSRLTRRAMEAAGLDTRQVWLHYFSLTGAAGEHELDAYLSGLMPLPEIERDYISHAVNELARGHPSRLRAPYTFDSGGEGTAGLRGARDKD